MAVKRCIINERAWSAMETDPSRVFFGIESEWKSLQIQEVNVVIACNVVPPESFTKHGCFAKTSQKSCENTLKLKLNYVQHGNDCSSGFSGNTRGHIFMNSFLMLMGGAPDKEHNSWRWKLLICKNLSNFSFQSESLLGLIKLERELMMCWPYPSSHRVEKTVKHLPIDH